jgi:hypothetical protein
MTDAKISVTKLDAARRQLRVAIRLWFTEGDPVAVHTLASAAHEIIHALFKRKGLHGLMFDSRVIKDEYRGEWAKIIKAKASFFKHAQKDPDATLEFNPAVNLGLLLAGTAGLQKMGEAPNMEESAFTYWLRIHRPTWFRIDRGSDGVPVDPFEKFRGIGKREFFDAFEHLWREGGIAKHDAALEL